MQADRETGLVWAPWGDSQGVWVPGERADEWTLEGQSDASFFSSQTPPPKEQHCPALEIPACLRHYFKDFPTKVFM